MPQEFEAALAKTLADRHLSGQEKEGLARLLSAEKLDDPQRNAFRHRAFELARGALPGDDGQQVLDWLEAVLRVLYPQSNQPPPLLEAHFSPWDNCVGRIASLLAAAHRTADLCVFTITDNRIAAEVLRAHDRGVQVRIVTDDEKVSDEGSDVERLARAGVLVRTDRSAYHMHHKFAVLDGRLVLTGSYNWTRSAADHNMENFIVSGDSRLVAAYSKAFERLWQEYGDPSPDV
jgi:phosphatidylserine/phosphatidylglycerophosphate/cardiolipin synthase-like enzyme